MKLRYIVVQIIRTDEFYHLRYRIQFVELVNIVRTVRTMFGMGRHIYLTANCSRFFGYHIHRSIQWSNSGRKLYPVFPFFPLNK